MSGELPAEQIGLGADALNQLSEPAYVALSGFELVTEFFHPLES